VSGQDYDPQGGRYAPVVTLIVFKIVCVLIVVMEMFAHIVNVRGAFLTGDLSDSPVYIEVPEGMEKKVKATADAEAKAKGVAPMSLTDIVLMLQKSLYGLVQSSHLFWRKQSKAMMDELKLERSIVDYCLYYKWIGDKLFVSISWVDDMIMACANLSDERICRLQN
jgi:Reverse transcriptase (RNA-dependent DNA polymerase)